MNRVSLRTVDLQSCGQEPIRFPGTIQSHGFLLSLDLDGSLTHCSRNARSFLPGLPELGARPSTSQVWQTKQLHDGMLGMLEDLGAGYDVAPLSLECLLESRTFDAVLHSVAGGVIVEFEPRHLESAALATFALVAHRKMSRVRGRSTIEATMSEAVIAISGLTGFDRVMAYRFHSDDSGEIIAEALAGGMEPYLGRRFPAADIPAQARQLYVLNTLRVICDVDDQQVIVDSLDSIEEPLDMSNAILRSVSPIHIEYLRNINVGASMSISIVIAGRLWGLIACHHRQPHRVSYSIRMACDVLAGVVATSVALLLEKAVSERRAATVGVRALLDGFGAGNADGVPELAPLHVALGRLIASDRMIFTHGGEVRHDGIDARGAIELVQWLEAGSDEMVVINEVRSLPAAIRDMLFPLCGLLALRHDRVNRGWVILLRNEQSATVTWSGPPDKVARVGPLGSRLTPNGSLAEWEQDVSGTCAPWDDLDISLSRQLLDEVKQATSIRAAEMTLARLHLLAVLGHDLRTPLHVISIAASMMQRGNHMATMADRISRASGRMSRLVSQVLDMSRLHGGLGLGLVLKTTNLSQLVSVLVEDAQIAYPGVVIAAELVPEVEAEVDADRLTQAIDNLISNARQHGTIGEALRVRVCEAFPNAVIEVFNVAAPLSAELQRGLFDPLKRGSLANQHNPHGLGLGLYIASETARGHHGSLRYSHDGRSVSFRIEIPMRSQGSAESELAPTVR